MESTPGVPSGVIGAGPGLDLSSGSPTCGSLGSGSCRVASPQAAHSATISAERSQPEDLAALTVPRMRSMFMKESRVLQRQVC